MQKRKYRLPLHHAASGLSTLVLVTTLALLAGCASVPSPRIPAPATPTPPVAASAPPATPSVVAPPAASAPTPSPEITVSAAPWRAAQWSELLGWQQDALSEAWPALLASCRTMRVAATVKAWSSSCEAARALGEAPSQAAIRNFMETRLTPWQVMNTDGTAQGLITGYYEPQIRANRTRNAQFGVPVLGVPDDMITVDFGELYPELKNMRLRGRLEGRKLVPYWSRAQIDAQPGKLPAKVLLYTEDPLELFFLQVQGSGQALLPDGSRVRLAYADQNGHPYKSIGRWLVDKGELKVEEASMQGIHAWAKSHPARLGELLAANPSYVFFREEAASGEGPKGSLGVPLTPMRSIAIDPRNIPLGSPVFIATTLPDGTAVQRLVLAQDTGGAIRGRVRADFFLGTGEAAGERAGRMRQQGSLWLLWPRDLPPPDPS